MTAIERIRGALQSEIADTHEVEDAAGAEAAAKEVANRALFTRMLALLDEAAESSAAPTAERLRPLLSGMGRPERKCADVAEALAFLAMSACGGVSNPEFTSGTSGIHALVGATILLARTSRHAPEVIEVAIEALRFAQRTLRAAGNAGRSAASS